MRQNRFGDRRRYITERKEILEFRRQLSRHRRTKVGPILAISFPRVGAVVWASSPGLRDYPTVIPDFFFLRSAD
jgi:hypothetical protein